MRFMPSWSKLKAVAHTLPYDTALTEGYQRGKPLHPARWQSVTIPTLVVVGGKSPAWMQHAMRALASAVPNASFRTLAGQTHMVKAKVLAPMLVEVLQGADGTRRRNSGQSPRVCVAAGRANPAGSGAVLRAVIVRSGSRSTGGRALEQQRALAAVARERRGTLELGSRLGEPAEFDEQIAADAWQEMIVVQRRL